MNLKALFASDKELMAILTIIADLELPDAWLAVLFVIMSGMSYLESQVCRMRVIWILFFMTLK